ncbi:hypothetical protein ACF1AX_35770 [Streptomyces sp. NPDC014802]|uniref:hypothetical protein n=1 Tax=Streptomyces sp. NPDC014802 TaxID=3364917 RepID=UPI0037001B40
MAFMDIAGLYLLSTPTTPTPGCRTTATGLAPEPLGLLLTAADVDPRVCDLSRLLPDTPSPVRSATPCIL